MRSSTTEGGTGIINGVVDIVILFAGFMVVEKSVLVAEAWLRIMRKSEQNMPKRIGTCHGISATEDGSKDPKQVSSTESRTDRESKIFCIPFC